MLRRHQELYLINSVTEDTVIFDAANLANGFSINGVHFLCADIETITSECPCPESAKTVTVTVQVPASCDCPYVWSLLLKGGITGETEMAFETFEETRIYEYEEPTGATPTAATIAADIADQINKDSFGFATATVVGAVITITAKSADKPFDAYTVQGTVAVTNAGQKSKLSGDALKKIFPVQPGTFGQGDLQHPLCGAYCKWVFSIKTEQQDVDGASHWLEYKNEIVFYVSNDAPNYQNLFANQVIAATANCSDKYTAIACPAASSSPSA